MCLPNRQIKITVNISAYTFIHDNGTSLFSVHIGVGAGPAGPVLAGPLLFKVKIKFHFCKKQVMNRSASVIFRLVRLIILLYNR